MRPIHMASGILEDLLTVNIDGLDDHDIENIKVKALQLWQILVITLPIICFTLVTLVIGWFIDFILRHRRRNV